MDVPAGPYTLTVEDYSDALQLHRKSNRSEQVKHLLVCYGVPLLCVICLVYYAASCYRFGVDAAIRRMWLAGSALFLIVAVPIECSLRAKKLWEKSQPTHLRDIPITIQFDETMVISARPGDIEGKFYWNSILGYAEDERIALIYVRSKAFICIPKRVLSKEEWSRLRAIARNRFVGEKAC